MTHCPAIKLSGISFASSSAFAIAPGIPFEPSVRTISAPYALIILRLSTLIVSGRTIISLYPLAAAIAARPIPVLPDVGSIIVEPAFNNPLLSASSIISLAILSLTLPAGLRYSSFAKIVASSLYFFSICFNSTNGVLPINSATEPYIFDILTPCLSIIYTDMFYSAIALNASSKSSIISSIFSVPIESLIVLGLIP